MRWVGGILAGMVLGAGLVLAYERYATYAEPGDALAKAWRAMPRDAAALNRKERFLHATLEQLAPVNGSSLYNITIQRNYDQIARRHLGDRPVRVLELGPGINLGSGLAFCLLGAQKYYGLDLYTDPDFYGAPQYQSIVRLLETVAPQLIRTRAGDCMHVADEKVQFDPRRMEYLYPRQSYDIPLPERSLDYVFSHAVFEHITDPQRTVDAIARVLVGGGLTVHQIDLRDHRDFSRPFDFLKIDEATWQAKHQGPGSTNRWRASDFRAAFERAGFQVLEVDANARVPVDEDLRRSMDPRFQRYSLEDLSILGMRLVARKP